MKRVLMTAVVFCGMVLPVFAQDMTMPRAREDVPDVYVVKKGDTLWDIAEMFFDDPFSWPDIWQRNLFIEDPHWIYPGQELTLADAMRLLAGTSPEPAAAAPQPAPAPEPPAPAAAPLRQPEPQRLDAAPRVTGVSGRTTADDTVLRLLPQPQPAYRRESYLRTGFIIRRSEVPREEVVAVEGGFHSATRNDVITIDIPGGGSLHTGDLIAILAVGDRVKHPDTGEDLGVVVRIKGIAEILSQGDKDSRCRLTENFDPVLTGDRVMPISVADAPEFDAWVRPDDRIDATILAINDPLLSVHLDDILYIDKGSREGVRPGDRFTVYGRGDDGADTGHRTPIGEVQAVNVMPEDTAVIVISMKEMQMDIGDRAELTARCRLVN